MLTHRGFSTWITCEGVPLPEFERVTDANRNRVSCWIPSEEGKTFVVHWRDHGGGVDTAAYLDLDGFSVPGRFLFGEGESYRDAVRVGEREHRPFIFANPPEPLEGVTGPTNSKHVGTIVLTIQRIRRGPACAPNGPQNAPRIARRRTSGPVIGFGEVQRGHMQEPSTWSVQPYDPKEPPIYVTFLFRYRSQDFLISEGIMSPDEAWDIAMPEDLTDSQPMTPEEDVEEDAEEGILTPSPSPSPGSRSEYATLPHKPNWIIC